MEVRVVSGKGKSHGPTCGCLVCPHCGATEVDDCTKAIREWKWQIRGFRVDDSSECRVCGKWFDLKGKNLTFRKLTVG